MYQLSRRKFLNRSFGLSAAAFLGLGRTEPDTILHNAQVITVDPRQPRAQAIAVAGDRLFAVGTNDEVLSLAGGRTSKMDLGGKTVVPGFIDAHSHPSYAGIRHLHWVDCDLRSVADIQAAIRTRAEQKEPGTWVLGFKYDDTKTSDGRPLRLSDLDAAAPRHPVRIVHRGGHTCYVNSQALAKANITENTPDPEGGRFDRDPATGKLNGRLSESAMGAVERFIPQNYTRDDFRQGVALITRLMARSGVTSVHDAGASPDDLRAYQDAKAAGELSARIYCLIRVAHLEKMIAAGVKTGLGDHWVRVGAVKLAADGSISERTARLSSPYVGRPNDFGILVTKEDELYRQALMAHEADWQIGVHANGDVAIDMTLGIFERLQRLRPRPDPRFRLEHCTVINPDLVRRIKALGAIPNPFSTYVYYHGEKMREYGAERLERMFAVRSFLDAGISVTQTSDYPPGPFEPMMALQSSVTRTDIRGTTWGPGQRVTVEEAIKVGTLHGAYASYEEQHKGSLEAGKLADLVVLGRDPLREDPATLVTIPIERTMVGGKWVWEAGS
jgi:predicted amidohydrolase YtcJ